MTHDHYSSLPCTERCPHQVVRIAPSGTRFVWSIHDSYASASEARSEAFTRAYGAAFAFGGDAMLEPIRFVVEAVA